MTVNGEYEDKAARIGRAFSTQVNAVPSAHTCLMAAVDVAVGPSYKVVVAGNSAAEDTLAMLKALGSSFVPNEVVLLRSADKEPPEIVRFAPFTERQRGINGKATAYVCVNYNCKLPTPDIRKMLELLGGKH